jgi:hypothetical protein
VRFYFFSQIKNDLILFQYHPIPNLYLSFHTKKQMSNPTIYIEETPDNFVNILDPKMEEKLTVDADTGIDTDKTKETDVAKIDNVNGDNSTDGGSKNTFDHAREHVQNEIETEIPENSENYADDDVDEDVDDDVEDDVDEDVDDDVDNDVDEDDSASTPSSLPDLVSVSEPMQQMQPSPSAEKELVDFYKTNYMIMLGFLMYLLFLVICSYTLIVLHINKNC